jgi:anhydro-N-acetylmuramic acid kinase
MRLWLDVVQLPVSLIGYHGQTIFHDPSVGLTFQLGHPAIVAAYAGVDVVGDFRVYDVATGGHGAPLVPAGDRYLFHAFDACVNLGGFANYSTEKCGILRAADICPVNMVLNHLSRRTGAEYDAGGQLARTGKVIPELFAELENNAFFKLSGPKSLGREWVEKEVLPLLTGYPIRDLMCTYAEHIASRIADALVEQKGKVLFTGGGTHNMFLMERIMSKLQAEAIIPDATVIDFKEAIIFGFLALMRHRGEVNVFSSVTGGKSDHCAGGIFLS